MAMVFTEAIPSTAANIATRAKRSKTTAGCCASEETKAKILAVW